MIEEGDAGESERREDVHNCDVPLNRESFSCVSGDDC